MKISEKNNNIMNNYDNYINKILKTILNKNKKNYTIIRNAISLRKRINLNPLTLKNEPQKEKSFCIEDKNLINNLYEFKEEAYNLISNYNQEKKRASKLVINNKIFQKDYSKIHHKQNNIKDNYYLNKSWMIDIVNKYYNKGFQKVPSLNIEHNIFSNNPLIIGENELISFFSYYKKENSEENSKNFLEKSFNILEEKLGLNNSMKKDDEKEKKRKKEELKKEIEENYNKIDKIKDEVVKSKKIFNNLESIDKIFQRKINFEKQIPKINLLKICKNNNNNNNNNNDNNLINEYSFINNNSKSDRIMNKNKFNKNSIFKYYIRNINNIKSLSNNISPKEKENIFDFSSFNDLNFVDSFKNKMNKLNKRNNLLFKKQIISKSNSSTKINSNLNSNLNSINDNLINNNLTFNHSNKDFIMNVYNNIKKDNNKFYLFEKEFYNFCIKNNKIINKDISKKGLYHNFLNIKKVFKNNNKNIILKLFELKNKEAKKKFFSNYQKEILLKNDNLNVKFNKIDSLVKEKLYDFDDDKDYYYN